MIRIALHGATGKMGQVLQTLISEKHPPEFQISVALHRGSPESDWKMLENVDGIIDFTSAQGLHQLLDRLLRADVREKKPFLLTGSTGFSSDVRRDLEVLARTRQVLWAANFSPGVFLLSRALHALRDHPLLSQFKRSMKDLHHAQKKDAPSGTALILQQSLGGEIPIESIREGTIIGRHEVVLRSPFETVELIHEAHDRRLFAQGALLAARQLNRRSQNGPSGLFTLEEIFSSVESNDLA